MYEKVKALLTGKFEVDESEFTASATFEEMGLTSLDMVEFAEIASKEWGTPITDDEIYELNRIDRIIELLEQRRAPAAP